MRVNFSRQPINIDKVLETASHIKSCINEIKNNIESDMYLKPESFCYLPYDEKQLIKIIEFKKEYDTKNLKKIILIGIGGSIQGTKAIYELLKNTKDLIEIEFIDQIDSEKLNKTLSHLKRYKDEEYTVVLITKSGTTTESLYNFEVLKDFINLKRLIVITEEHSHLIPICKSKKIHSFIIPKKISGRFSVFSFVGLLPLALSGVNIVKLLEGAMNQINSIFDQSENLPIQSAAIKFLNRKVINENLYPTRHFGEIGKWEKQLFNESLGKTSLSPFTSFGNFFLELHSSLQFYLNSKNIFINTLYVKESDPILVKEVEFLSKNFNSTETEEINKAIFTSVVKELEKNQIPSISIELHDAKETEIGNYMQFKMLEVYFLAKLLDINPFDQPEVNSYKEQLIKYI